MSTPAGSVWRPVYRRSTGSKGGPAAVLHHSASAVKAIRSRTIGSGGHAEGVPAIDAAVLAVGLAALDEDHAVSGHGADERMGHLGQAARREEERVPASAGVLGEALPLADHVHVMPEEVAQVADLLVEEGRIRVGITADGEEQGVAAADARVLVVTVAGARADVGVVTEEAAQDVAGGGGGAGPVAGRRAAAGPR